MDGWMDGWMDIMYTYAPCGKLSTTSSYYVAHASFWIFSSCMICLMWPNLITVVS